MKTIQVRCDSAIKLDIDDLVPFQDGLKDLDKSEYEKLKKEIIETGFAFPFNVWKSGDQWKLISGHQRHRVLKTMRSLGYEIPPLPCAQIQAKDESEAKRRILQDASSYGRVNQDGLEEFLHNANFSLEFAADSFRLPDVNLDRMFEGSAEFGTQGLTDPDEIPEVKETRAKLGDIWKLGNHRLMCGDSTSIDESLALMGGEEASVVFTDPPYGYKYESNYQSKHTMLENDDKILDFLPVAYALMSESSAIYMCGSHQTIQKWRPLIDAHFEYKNMIVWKKNNWSMGDLSGAFAGQHELILFAHKGRVELIGGRSPDVWEFDRDPPKDHPTQKPVPLVEFAIEKVSKPGANVLDLFGGSGSTLIACEKTNRRCFMMELDPKYVDVIIARWEAYTGRKAELLHG